MSGFPTCLLVVVVNTFWAFLVWWGDVQRGAGFAGLRLALRALLGLSLRRAELLFLHQYRGCWCEHVGNFVGFCLGFPWASLAQLLQANVFVVLCPLGKSQSHQP